MPTKLSASQVHAVLSEVPSTLMALVQERDEALSKLASAREELESYRSSERMNKLAAEMEDRGFRPGNGLEDTMEFLSKQADAGKLDVVEQAVAMSAPDTPIGWLGDTSGGNAVDELTSYCLGELVD